MKKLLAEVKEVRPGVWKIITKGEEWIDEFENSEEATTYALRNGCKVEGC